MGMVWEPRLIYSKSEGRNGMGESVCCSGEEDREEEMGWESWEATPARTSLIKLLMEHQIPEQDSAWVGNESEEESGGSTKMVENLGSMGWVLPDLTVGEAAQDMNVMLQRQNDNGFWQHPDSSACMAMAMAPSIAALEPLQSASLAFSKLLGLQDLPSSSHQIAPAQINPWPPSSSGPFVSAPINQFFDSKPLLFHSSTFDSHSNSKPPLPFLHYSSPFKPSPSLIKTHPSASDCREPGRKRARITPTVSSISGIRRSPNSDPSKPKRNGSRKPAFHALNTNLKPRAKQGCANDPQSIAARHRRERISERLKILQDLIPNGSKVDLVTMLEKAINYVKFLQLQVKVLMKDEFWATQQEEENPDQPSSDITTSHEYNGSM